MASQFPKLHLGSGLVAPPGWINIDASWNAWLAKHPGIRWILKMMRLAPAAQFGIPWSANVRVHDVRTGLPFADESVSAIYASHLLEHLYREEAKRLLKECYRTLRPSGVLRLVVPDLRAIVTEYVSAEEPQLDGDPEEPSTPADRLNRRLGFHDPCPHRGGYVYHLYSRWKDLHTHKWMYDGDTLRAYLEWAGFVSVEEKGLHESRIDGIAEVERAVRICGGEGVCVEGVKPSAHAAVRLETDES